jgi:hypothetical protein
MKVKYGLFRTIRMLCTWIKNYPLYFIFTIFTGIILSFIFGDSINYTLNPLLFFVKSIADTIILIGIIVFVYIKYTKMNYDLKLKTYMKLILISILFFLYNLGITIFTEQMKNLFSIILQFIGLFVIILCIIDIIKNKNIFGIKFGINTLFTNTLFFIKVIVFIFIFQIILLILFGIIFSSFHSEFKIRILLSLGVLIRIITAYIIIIFVSEKEKEKNIYNENLYVA